MKLFADTASLEEIALCFKNGANDGITTNPKIMELTGDLSSGIEHASRELIRHYPAVPISLETDLQGISLDNLDQAAQTIRDHLMMQAHQLANLGPNVVVKIPVCKGGLQAVESLTKEGIRTNVTACMTPFQAIESAKAGATYVSLFANRMLDCALLTQMEGSLAKLSDKSDWKSVIKAASSEQIEQAWQAVLEAIYDVSQTIEPLGSELIVGSIRQPSDVLRIASARPHIITIPTGIMSQLNGADIKSTPALPFNSPKIVGDSLSHPMTHLTILEFEESAKKYHKVS